MAQDKEATKDCIFSALIALMEQKEYKYITVTDIARKSGVSRMTYYRTYSSKEDILVQHFRKIAKQMVTRAEGDVSQALAGFYTYFQKYDNLTAIFAQSDLMHLVVESFSEFTDFLYDGLHPDSAKTAETGYATCYETGGLFSILTGWLAGGAKESPAEMSDITLRIMKK